MKVKPILSAEFAAELKAYRATKAQAHADLKAYHASEMKAHVQAHRATLPGRFDKQASSELRAAVTAKLFVLALLAIMATCFVLAGCGGGEDHAANDPQILNIVVSCAASQVDCK